MRSLEENVGAVMTRKVVTCAETDTIALIMGRMTRQVPHLPVVDQGQLVGVISIGDVVEIAAARDRARNEALREYIATA